MFTLGFEKTAETIDMFKSDSGAYKPILNKNKNLKHAIIAGGAIGGGYLLHKLRSKNKKR
jgi:hypothetical protein